MPLSFSYAISMNLEHSIKEGSHERYPDHLQCFRNIKKIKYPDFFFFKSHFKFGKLCKFLVAHTYFTNLFVNYSNTELYFQFPAGI